MITNGTRKISGLADNYATLLWFVEGAAETSELDQSNADVTEELVAVAQNYDQALFDTLETYPGNRRALATAEELFTHGDAPYLVTLSLNGSGRTILDGDWDHFFDDPEKDIPAIETYLKEKLAAFVTDCGTGRLLEAFDSAAFETCQPKGSPA